MFDPADLLNKNAYTLATVSAMVGLGDVLSWLGSGEEASRSFREAQQILERLVSNDKNESKERQRLMQIIDQRRRLLQNPEGDILFPHAD